MCNTYSYNLGYYVVLLRFYYVELSFLMNKGRPTPGQRGAIAPQPPSPQKKTLV